MRQAGSLRCTQVFATDAEHAMSEAEVVTPNQDANAGKARVGPKRGNSDSPHEAGWHPLSIDKARLTTGRNPVIAPPPRSTNRLNAKLGKCGRKRNETAANKHL